jgi:hypothetical protein
VARYILYIVATGIHASRDIPYLLYIVATGIHASRDIPYFLYIVATGIHASRDIPYLLYIKKKPRCISGARRHLTVGEPVKQGYQKR